MMWKQLNYSTFRLFRFTALKKWEINRAEACGQFIDYSETIFNQTFSGCSFSFVRFAALCDSYQTVGWTRPEIFPEIKISPWFQEIVTLHYWDVIKKTINQSPNNL